MKAITKRFLAVFLSLIIVIAPTIQQANAASAWSITSVISAGARAIVSATKSGYKSAVNISPTAVRLGAGLLRVGNGAALLFAATQLANDGFDFVLDPANNRVKYKVKVSSEVAMDEYCRAEAARSGHKFDKVTSITQTYGTTYYCTNSSGQKWGIVPYGRTQDIIVEKYIPVPTAAAQVLKNAQNGNTVAQAAVRQVATEMVVGGQFDQDLLSGAVPISDNKPLVPAVPGNGNGNVTHGSDVGIGEGGTTGATPGQQSDAAKDAADAAKAAAEAAVDASKAAAEDARKAADAAQDLINSGADTAAIDAAKAAADAATQAAADLKAAADAAIGAANDRARAAEQAAAAATQAAQAAATQAAADLAAAQAAGDAAAVAAAEAAKAAADAAVADAKAKQAEAEKAAEKAKAEAAKPFELPAFCTWAAIVCETAEWLKREPETPEITAIDTDSPIDDFDSDKSYITFTGSCPPKYTASLSIMGATAPFEFDYTPICTVMSYLKPFIVGAGYMAAAYIIAGHSRGSKD